MKRCLENQKITLKDALLPEPTWDLEPMEPIRDSNPIAAIALIGIGVIMGMMVLAGVRRCDGTPKPVQKECSSCHNRQMSMTKYFTQNGSKSPEEMAYAVLQTKSPRLLASVAVVESNGNPHLRNTGYKKRHHGAFQVNPKHWGKVPKDAVGQALQVQDILSKLAGERRPIETTLNLYGGDSTDQYQKRVLAELTRVP